MSELCALEMFYVYKCYSCGKELLGPGILVAFGTWIIFCKSDICICVVIVSNTVFIEGKYAFIALFKEILIIFKCLTCFSYANALNFEFHNLKKFATRFFTILRSSRLNFSQFWKVRDSIFHNFDKFATHFFTKWGARAASQSQEKKPCTYTPHPFLGH